MKKIFVTLMTMFALMMLTACGGASVGSADSNTATEPAAKIESAKPASEGSFGDCYVKINDACIVEDGDGDSALQVDFDFTNNSSEATYFTLASYPQAFQDGVELELTWIEAESEEYDNSYKDIRDGATLKCCLFYKLRNETSDVELEVSDQIDYNADKTLKKNFSIK